MLIDRASEGRNMEIFDRNACILNRFSLVDRNTGDDYSIFTTKLIDIKQKMTLNVKSQKSHIGNVNAGRNCVMKRIKILLN